MIVLTGLLVDGEHYASPFAGGVGDVGEIPELSFRLLKAVAAVHIADVAFETITTKDALEPAVITGL